jgi:SLOG cluster4 family
MSTDERPGRDPRGSGPAERLNGPVLRRRQQIRTETTDQRLLDQRGPSDWVHTDPWRVLRIQSEFVEGFGLLAELPRAVSVFGSARTTPSHPEYATGLALGAALARAGFAVITGGGPGTMEAVNRGTSEAGGVSVGLGVELPFEQRLNDWVDIGINFRYFFARKTMFVKYAQAFVILPGCSKPSLSYRPARSLDSRSFSSAASIGRAWLTGLRRPCFRPARSAQRTWSSSRSRTT